MKNTISNSKCNASHLTLADRNVIQDSLSHCKSFTQIAKLINKDKSTVAREVKKHLVYFPSTVVHLDKNKNQIFPTCERLTKAPYACNGCKRANTSCKYDRYKYIASAAQNEYKNTLVEKREGINLTQESFYKLDNLIKDGVEKGQHIYQILVANNLQNKKSTVYSNIKKNIFSTSAISLPRAVKFKPRKSKKTATTIPKKLKIGRDYQSFCDYIKINPTTTVTQMDTVIGRPGGKCLVTLISVPYNFMFALLTDNKTAENVTKKNHRIKKTLCATQLEIWKYFQYCAYR